MSDFSIMILPLLCIVTIYLALYKLPMKFIQLKDKRLWQASVNHLKGKVIEKANEEGQLLLKNMQLFSSSEELALKDIKSGFKFEHNGIEISAVDVRSRIAYSAGGWRPAYLRTLILFTVINMPSNKYRYVFNSGGGISVGQNYKRFPEENVLDMLLGKTSQKQLFLHATLRDDAKKEIFESFSSVEFLCLERNWAWLESYNDVIMIATTLNHPHGGFYQPERLSESELLPILDNLLAILEIGYCQALQ